MVKIIINKKIFKNRNFIYIVYSFKPFNNYNLEI